jgi:hypothetical protein
MLRHFADAISRLPGVSAMYAMYGGRGRGLHVAYVGIADDLRGRISQHLIKRDSSVTTGTSAVGLNPDLISEIRWREVLEAASLTDVIKAAFSIILSSELPDEIVR